MKPPIYFGSSIACYIFIYAEMTFKNSACVVSTQSVPSQDKGGGFMIGLASQRLKKKQKKKQQPFSYEMKPIL